MDRLMDGSQLVTAVVDSDTRRALVAYARRYTHRKEDAEDIVQDALLAAARFQGECTNPIPWLRRIVLNECRMRFRARSYVRRGGDVAHVSYQDHISIASSPDPETALVERERQMRFDDGMKRLRPCDREVLDRYVGDGLSLEEIALEAHATPQAIKSRLFRARRSLTQAVAG